MFSFLGISVILFSIIYNYNTKYGHVSVYKLKEPLFSQLPCILLYYSNLAYGI